MQLRDAVEWVAPNVDWLLRMQTAPNVSPSGLFAPDVSLSAPDVSLSAPDVSLSAPDVSLSAPDVSAPNLSAGAGSGVLQEQEMVSSRSRKWCPKLLHLLEASVVCVCMFEEVMWK